MVAGGDNSFDQASPPSYLANVVAVIAGKLHSAALCSNGTVVVWGDNTFGQTNVPAGLSNLVAIAAGDFHTFALCSNGRVIGWGDNTFGQTTVPSNVTNAIGVASGYYHGLTRVPFIQLLRPQLTRSGLILNWNGTGVLQWSPTPAGPLHRRALSRQSLDKCGHVGTSKILPRAPLIYNQPVCALGRKPR